MLRTICGLAFVLLVVVGFVVAGCSKMPPGTKGTVGDRIDHVKSQVVAGTDNAIGYTAQVQEAQENDARKGRITQNIADLERFMEQYREGTYSQAAFKNLLLQQQSNLQYNQKAAKNKARNLVTYIEKGEADPEIKEGKKPIVINGDKYTMSALLKDGANLDRELRILEKRDAQINKHIEDCEKNRVQAASMKEYLRGLIIEAKADLAMIEEQNKLMEMQKSTTLVVDDKTVGKIAQELQEDLATSTAKQQARIEADNERIQESAGHASLTSSEYLDSSSVVESLKAYLPNEPKSEVQ